MGIYSGVEKIDPIERQKQHELTKALWRKLCEMGVKTGDKGRINGILTTQSYERAEELKARLHNDDFGVTIYRHEEDQAHIVQLTTPISRLTMEALVELADILMIEAAVTETTFDGLELDINEIKKLNTPWWKFW